MHTLIKFFPNTNKRTSRLLDRIGPVDRFGENVKGTQKSQLSLNIFFLLKKFNRPKNIITGVTFGLGINLYDRFEVRFILKFDSRL